MTDQPAVELPTLPTGSTIQIERSGDEVSLAWSQPSGGLLRYVIAAFLAVWLCGWLFGLVSVVVQLVTNPDAPKAFLAIWLAFWTVGGTFAIAFLYLLLRPARDERLTLSTLELRHDPGRKPPIALVNPFYAYRNGNPFNSLAEVFNPPKKRSVPRGELGPFRLSNLGERQRLTYDLGADRIEIGEALREPEREWLAKVIEDWRTA